MAEQPNLNGLLDRSIFALSGGEKQKIACGSTAAIRPEVFVFDEPSSNLDAYVIEDLRKLLKVLEGKTVIIAECRLYYLNLRMGLFAKEFQETERIMLAKWSKAD